MLVYLARHSQKSPYAIKEDLKRKGTNRDYSSINVALHNLVKKGLAKKEEKIGKRKKLLFTLTEQGVAKALTINGTLSVSEILSNYPQFHLVGRVGSYVNEVEKILGKRFSSEFILQALKTYLSISEDKDLSPQKIWAIIGGVLMGQIQYEVRRIGKLNPRKRDKLKEIANRIQTDLTVFEDSKILKR